MSIRVEAKMPQKCKVCGKDIKVGDIIFKLEDGHWCKDENCGKANSLPKVDSKPPANQTKDQGKIKVFGENTENKPDIDPTIEKKSKDIEKMFEVVTEHAVEFSNAFMANTSFTDKEFAKKQAMILFSVYLKGGFDNWNK